MWGRGRSNLWRVRDRTGGLAAHFFTQNSRRYFFEAATRKEPSGDRSEKLSQFNGGAYEKTSRNPGGEGNPSMKLTLERPENE